MKKLIVIILLLALVTVATGAYNSYTNGNVYVIVKVGENLPDSCLVFPEPPAIGPGVFPSAGEGINCGKLSDGRNWYKNMFWGKEGIDQLRDLVHAEDAGKLELKTSKGLKTVIKALKAAEIK